MKRVDVDDLDWNDDLTVVYDGVPFTGEAVEQAPTGQIVTVTSYLDGVRHGPSTEWYTSGQMRAHGVTRYGMAVGVHKSWHPNGQLAKESVFDDAGLVSREEWDEQGNPIPGSTYRRARPQ
jgi:antitoxin component YwqK of YwqJK toxin-antitoxin module